MSVDDHFAPSPSGGQDPVADIRVTDIRVTDLGRVVQDGRRRLGLAVAGLALASGRDEGVVRRIEEGDDVPPTDSRAVLEALGLDPTPHVGGTPHGPVPVPAVDPMHGRTMTYLADAARDDGGWVLFPDAEAFARTTGYSVDALNGTRAASEGWRHPATGVGNVLTFAGVALGAAVVASVTLGYGAGGSSSYPWFAGTALIAMGLALLGLGVGVYGRTRDNPLHPAYFRMFGAHHRMAAMRTSAAVVTPRGIVTYATTPQALARREYLASSVVSVDLVDEDPAHVTIHVWTLVGHVELPWVPRVRDVVATVASWVPPREGTVLEGPQ